MADTKDQEQSTLLSSDDPTLHESPKHVAPTAPPSAAAQTPSARHRPGYSRVPSIPVIDEDTIHSLDAESPKQTSHHGLGINYGPGESSPKKARRVSIQPLSSRVPLSSQPYDNIASPLSIGALSGSTAAWDSPETDTSYPGGKTFAKTSLASLQSTNSESELLRNRDTNASLRTAYNEFAAAEACRSAPSVKQGKASWLALALLALSIYSTVFSGIFLVIAFHGPRYGKWISTSGAMNYATASVLVALFAKTIELSFVTAVVAFLGQVLARRAASRKTGAAGVTLAEMSMRTWIMQPGSLFTNFESVRYAGLSLLGLIALSSTLTAMLYTTASNALVQPQLKWHVTRGREMAGLVKTQFANPSYIQKECKSPVPESADPEEGPQACLQLEHAAFAFHNFQKYHTTWAAVSMNGTGSPDLAFRPPGFALLNDNTTITAPFIELYESNMTETFERTSIIVNNVSMAMPHVGVVQASQDPVNGIMQPSDLDGLGIYSVRASVPSPVIRTLCISATADELAPFVYDSWEGAVRPVDTTIWPSQLAYADPFLGGTKYDDIFRWGEAYGYAKWPPVFPKLPINFNTIVNDTTGIPWGRDSLYVLGKGPDAEDPEAPTYALCQLRASLSPDCSTVYSASNSGATLEAICEDPNDDMRYIESLKNATSGNFSVAPDWANIGSLWSWALALNGGMFDGNGSNSRLLTHGIPTTPALSLHMPSPAEALSVMAGNTLLSASKDSPFVQFFNYSAPDKILDPGQYQYFNASIRAQQYASGGTAAYQKPFYIVLTVVFVTNVIVLAYFLSHRHWFTDFSEPPNMFSIAVNSPPSEKLAGAGGGGPHGEQYRLSWKLNQEGGHVYMENQEMTTSEGRQGLRKRFSEHFELVESPVTKAYNKLNSRRSRT
ncbi:hypothetical protein MBLNU230_g6832t1 [Neophaeotheca triangularis]